MSPSLDAAEFSTRLIAFLKALQQVSVLTEDAIDAAVAATDAPLAHDRRDEPATYPRLTASAPDVDDLAAFEKKLRASIGRTLGATSGTDKHWDAGACEVHLRVSARGITLRLHPHYSLVQLRAAAASWLAGADMRSWLIGNRLTGDDIAKDDEGVWRSPDAAPGGIRARETDDRSSASLFLEPGVRPPGDRSTKDDARFDATLAFLSEELGHTEIPGWWHRGSRAFRIRRMRTYTRSLEFTQSSPGHVVGSNGQRWALPASPDPVPEEAAALLARIAERRSAPWPEALADLGLAAASPDHGLILTHDATGRPVEITVIDGRISGGTVEVAGLATPQSEVDAALSAEFGPLLTDQTRRLWQHGPLEVSSRTTSTLPASRIERRIATIAESTASEVATASAALLGPSPIEIPPRSGDDWHQRCVGAAISAEVVPPATPGEPLWRIGTRLVWLDANGMHAATDPAWLSTVPAGGSFDVTDAEATAFLSVIPSWRTDRIDEMVSTLIELGWASPDPDAVVKTPGYRVWNVRMLRPAGQTFWARIDDRGVMNWTVKIAIGESAERLSALTVGRLGSYDVTAAARTATATAPASVLVSGKSVS